MSTRTIIRLSDGTIARLSDGSIACAGTAPASFTFTHDYYICISGVQWICSPFSVTNSDYVISGYYNSGSGLYYTRIVSVNLSLKQDGVDLKWVGTFDFSYYHRDTGVMILKASADISRACPSLSVNPRGTYTIDTYYNTMLGSGTTYVTPGTTLSIS